MEEAERFGDEELQHPVRQVVWWAFQRDKSPLRSYSEGAKLGIPIGLAVSTAGPIIALEKRIHAATDENVRADLAVLGGLLQRVDDLIAAGTLNGEELNAADFQIAPSIRLAMTFQDLRPLIRAGPPGSSPSASSLRLPVTSRRSFRQPGCSRCAANSLPPPERLL